MVLRCLQDACHGFGRRSVSKSAALRKYDLATANRDRYPTRCFYTVRAGGRRDLQEKHFSAVRWPDGGRNRSAPATIERCFLRQRCFGRRWDETLSRRTAWTRPYDRIGLHSTERIYPRLAVGDGEALPTVRHIQHADTSVSRASSAPRLYASKLDLDEMQLPLFFSYGWWSCWRTAAISSKPYPVRRRLE